jgi:hypothetical protein
MRGSFEERRPATVCQAFEIIFSLLSKLDEGTDDILFFADEGASWERFLKPFVTGPRLVSFASRYFSRTTAIFG